MKKLLILVSILALAACSSKEKQEDTSNTENTAVEQPAEAQTAQDSSEQDDAKNEEASNEVNEPDMNGGFPDVEGTERSGATCKNGSTERLVSVIDTREGPCGVVYTKNSNKKTVAYAKNDMSYCDKVFDNIVGNLTAGGYDCGGAGNTAAASSNSDGGTAEEDNAEEKTEEVGE